MADAPVFIVGTERSGSNLLRLILNAHSRITVPHPPHILKYFAPIEASYGDLSQDENLAALIRDVGRLLAVHIHPWEPPMDAAAVLRDATPRDLMGVFAAIYDQQRQATGKARWGCKSTFVVHYLDRVVARFPDARFVWLVRDPRDVAASSRKSVFSPFHPYLTAQLWVAQQRLGDEALQKLGPSQVHLLRYEDLLAEPEARIRALCAFLGEEFEPAQLAFNRTEAAKKIAQLSESWANAGAPILSDNTAKYRGDLSLDELRAVESVAGPLMARFGYPLEFPGLSLAPITGPALAVVHAKDQWWRLGVELRSLRRDANHWRRWARGARMAQIGLEARLRRPAGTP